MAVVSSQILAGALAPQLLHDEQQTLVSRQPQRPAATKACQPNNSAGGVIGLLALMAARLHSTAHPLASCHTMSHAVNRSPACNKRSPAAFFMLRHTCFACHFMKMKRQPHHPVITCLASLLHAVRLCLPCRPLPPP